MDYCTDVVAMNAGRAPEVQVSHASAACLTLAGTHNDFGSLLDAPCKLLSLGLHTFLQWKAKPTCGVSHQAEQMVTPMARAAATKDDSACW